MVVLLLDFLYQHVGIVQAAGCGHSASTYWYQLRCSDINMLVLNCFQTVSIYWYGKRTGGISMLVLDGTAVYQYAGIRFEPDF